MLFSACLNRQNRFLTILEVTVQKSSSRDSAPEKSFPDPFAGSALPFPFSVFLRDKPQNRDNLKMSIKRFIILLLILFLLLGGGLLAYHKLDSDFTQIGRQMESADGHFTVSVPMKWEQTSPASDSGIMAARSSDKDMFMQISLDANSSDERSLEEHVRNYIKQIAQNSDDSDKQVTVVSPKRKKLDGHNGLYFELETISDDIEIHLWSYCYSTNSGFIHIDVTAPRNETENDQDIALGIIESLHQK